jgi:transcriptional regulator with XRE-family HTH domain
VGRKPKSASEKADEKRYLEQLGQHLKELRQAKNLTPQDLADKLGVTPQYIYMIESGRAKPSEKRLNDLASALGDLADEFRATAVTHVEDEFATKLQEAGLSPAEIEEAAKRVSARAKRDVASGDEEIVAMDRLTSTADASAFDYATSLKDEFGVMHSPRRDAPRPASPSTQPVEAGPDAKIVVNRPISKDERQALHDIGRVIARLLKR